MLRIEVDDNPDPNALSPQRLEIVHTDGRRILIDIPNTLGSPNAPLSAHQMNAKRDLCEALTAHIDRRLFNDPLGYFTEPQ